MKIRTAIIVSFSYLIAILQTEAQHWQQVDLTAATDQFTLEERNEGLVRIISYELDYQYPQGYNMPALPLIRISVLVPPGAELEDYSYTVEQVPVKENVQLARAPVPVPASQLDKYEPGYRPFSGSFPEATVSYIATSIQRGYTWFNFYYSPFRYDSETGNLTLARKVVLDLEYSVFPEENNFLSPDPALAGYIRERITDISSSGRGEKRGSSPHRPTT